MQINNHAKRSALQPREELNVFGSRTGHVERVQEGERLPSAPRGFTWRQIERGGS